MCSMVMPPAEISMQMSNLRELTFKEISYIREALESYVGILNEDSESHEPSDDERLDLQEDILFYENLLYSFQKAEKQSIDLRKVKSISVKRRE